MVEAVVRGGGGSSFEGWPSPPPPSTNLHADVIGIFNDAREFSLLLSAHILEGVAEVLLADYKWNRERVERYVRRLVEIAARSGGAVIEPTTSVADCADWEDNRILELALDSGALLVISDDRHLLEMSPWRGIPIVKPRDFVARVDAMRRARARQG